MRSMVVILILIFVVAFGYTEASRLANQSRALVTGIVIGIMASVPASILAALLAARTAAHGEPSRMAPLEQERPRMAAPPSVVVVNTARARSSRYAQYLDALPPPEPRHFTFTGDDSRE